MVSPCITEARIGAYTRSAEVVAGKCLTGEKNSVGSHQLAPPIAPRTIVPLLCYFCFVSKGIPHRTPAMLCELCKTAIQAVFTQMYRRGAAPFTIDAHADAAESVHTTDDSFLQGVAQGCLICRHLWGLVEPTSWGSDIPVNVDEMNYALSTRSPFKPTEVRYNLDWSVWSECHFIRIVTEGYYLVAELGCAPEFVLCHSSPRKTRGIRLLDQNSPPFGGNRTSSNPTLWRQWMRICSENHGQCRLGGGNRTFCPKRLVEVIPDKRTGTLSWKLTIWERPNPSPPEYLTLSHCWGSTLHTCLTKQNISSFMAASPAAGLPKTYQDAMSVTLSLGYRYLWIDSLCIIQGDSDDWKAQSAEMGFVYQNTSCNIAATWAREGSQGCFSARDPAMIDPTCISVDVGEDTEMFDVVYRRKWLDEVAEAPLNERAWVLQERYLSPRQLNFAKGEVYWECRQLSASERHPDDIPKPLFYPENANIPLSSKPRLDHRGVAQRQALRRAWGELVEKYTASKLTVYTDKMMAIAGLARDMKELLGGDVYLAGMWKNDLHKQLLWSVEEFPDPDDGHVSHQANVYLAPSWCWPSARGKIKMDESYSDFLGYPTAYLVEVLNSSVESRHASGLYDFVSGSLEIRGIALWAPISGLRILEEDQTKASADPIRSSAFAGGLDTELNFFFYWDEDYMGEEKDRWDMLLRAGRADVLFLFVKATWYEAADEDKDDDEDNEDNEGDEGDEEGDDDEDGKEGDNDASSSSLVMEVEGLVLISDDRGRCARVARFKIEGTEAKLADEIAGRLQIETGPVGFIEGFDLGDPRLGDMVQTVNII